MYPVLPLIIITGMTMGFVSGSLSHLLPKNISDADKNISTALIFFGLGTFTGGSITGFIVDRIGIKKGGKLNLIFY